MTTLSYLHIRGTLAENMTYRPKPGHESSRPGRRAEGHPDFQLVLLDREGRKLLSVAPQVSESCRSADDPHRYRVRGILPLRPDGVAYEVWRRDACLYGAVIPAKPPEFTAPYYHPSANGVTLHWQSCERQREARSEIDAPGSARDGALDNEPPHRMTYSIVAEMESGRRITVARGITGLAHNVDLSRMPVRGSGTLCLVANDGVRSAQVSVAPINVPSRPPTVHIVSPAPDTRIPFGQTLSILGCCLDMAGQPCAPEFSAWSIDGRTFAKGTFVTALEDLPPGMHKLTLTYQQPQWDRVDVSANIDVELPDESYRAWEALIGETQPPPKSA